MAVENVKENPLRDLGDMLSMLAQVVDEQGLDGALSAMIVACRIKEDEAKEAKDEVAQAKWHNRAYHCRAYRTMARGVEGRS